jgi:hypothetical protein
VTPLLNVSGKAVADVHAAEDLTALEMHDRVFETWRAMTHSAQGRDSIKRRLAWLVLVPIACEVLFFALGMLGASPDGRSAPASHHEHHGRTGWPPGHFRR